MKSKNEVTVDEFRNLLIENWVTIGGNRVFIGKGGFPPLARHQYNVDTLQKLQSQENQGDKVKARISDLQKRVAKSKFAPPKNIKEAEKQAGKNPIDVKGKTKEQIVKEFANRGVLGTSGRVLVNNNPESIKYEVSHSKKEELVDKANFYNTYGHVDRYWPGNASRVNDALRQTSTAMMKERKIFNKTDAEEKYGTKFNNLSDKWRNYVKGQKYGYIPENKQKEATAYMASLYKELD